MVRAASRQVEVRMQGEGEDEEDDMFSTNRKFNPNDLAYAGTVSSAAARAIRYYLPPPSPPPAHYLLHPP